MKNKIMRSLASFGTCILTLIAINSSTSACFIWMYQPSEPKCLSEN